MPVPERGGEVFDNNPFGARSQKTLFVFGGIFGVCVLLALLFLIFFLNSPPPTGAYPLQLEIPPGTSAQEVTRMAKERDLVRSATVLQVAMRIFYPDSPVRAGVYELTAPETALELAYTLTSGEESVTFVRFVVPEGLSAAEIDPILAELLPNVSPGDFEVVGRGYEGYLFPDTYFLDPSFDASSTAELMYNTFTEKTAPLAEAIAASGRTLEEVVTMASILEKEANDPVSMGLVAGILWDRFDIGMALQVDAPFSYALKKPLDELTSDDLAVDTPYNTYRYAGFPPTPIGNPGIVSLTAAVTPTPSPYLYYITGNDGNFYYARTFAEHRANIERYLKN